MIIRELTTEHGATVEIGVTLPGRVGILLTENEAGPGHDPDAAYVTFTPAQANQIIIALTTAVEKALARIATSA